MNLLSLQPARLSLEFTQAEFDTVQAGLRHAARRARRSPHIVRREGATHDMIEIGGEHFVLMIDDGGPGLVSTSSRGDAWLRDAVAYARSTTRRRAIDNDRHRDRLTRSGQLATA